MNREQQRRNARDQRRLEARKRAASGSGVAPPPAMTTRPKPSGRTVATPASTRSRWPSWTPWAGAGVVLLLIIAAVLLLDPLGLRTPAPGAHLKSQGNDHVNPGSSHVAYITDPPASGPHFPTVPSRGIYTTPFVTEYLPHFEEHGGVEVQYNKNAPQPVIDSLTAIVNKELDRGAGQVLIAPRPDMPCEVSLSSWQYIAVFNTDNCENGWLGQQSTPKVDPANKAWQGRQFDPNSSKDKEYVTTFIERNECRYDPENQCQGGAHGATLYNVTPAPGQPTVIASLGTATPGAGNPLAATPAPTPPPAVPTPTPFAGPLAAPTTSSTP